jgi:hypothetical protein
MWYTTSSDVSLEGHEEFIRTHVSTEFQVYCSSCGACEERDVRLAHIAPHPDIKWSSKINASYREWFGRF